ncbi:hypothetical protein IEQ34_002555 [Dendrobium chrysotoxum]|uniref:Uncharacterized protein n=1 Tax=Dendrobium chrysotoxum TaxID=161865 RepID=A0AAV7HP59_DENCH|nr:hypothetical protein IEQ34_002555 [Dendrobium chrysotoxum]
MLLNVFWICRLRDPAADLVVGRPDLFASCNIRCPRLASLSLSRRSRFSLEREGRFVGPRREMQKKRRGKSSGIVVKTTPGWKILLRPYITRSV